MTEDEQLAQRFKGQLEDELGDIQVRAGARERLRKGMRRPRRLPWLRTSVVVPLAAAAAIAALVLAIPAALDRDQRVEVVPAGPPPATAPPAPTPSVTVEPTPVTTPSDETTAKKRPSAEPTTRDPKVSERPAVTRSPQFDREPDPTSEPGESRLSPADPSATATSDTLSATQEPEPQLATNPE